MRTADVDSAQRFLRLWHRYLRPRGYPVPVLDLELRDEAWRQEVGRDFPFPWNVPEDASGFGYTANWRLHHGDLRKVIPHLLDALDRELRR